MPFKKVKDNFVELGRGIYELSYTSTSDYTKSRWSGVFDAVLGAAFVAVTYRFASAGIMVMAAATSSTTVGAVALVAFGAGLLVLSVPFSIFALGCLKAAQEKSGISPSLAKRVLRDTVASAQKLAESSKKQCKKVKDNGKDRAEKAARRVKDIFKRRLSAAFKKSADGEKSAAPSLSRGKTPAP